MTASRISAFAFVLLAFSSLAGCDKTSGTDSKPESIASPAAPDTPAAPDGVATPGNASTAEPVSAPTASAGAEVSVSGTEARAGDVSVKLPE